MQTINLNLSLDPSAHFHPHRSEILGRFLPSIWPRLGIIVPVSPTSVALLHFIVPLLAF